MDTPPKTVLLVVTVHASVIIVSPAGGHPIPLDNATAAQQLRDIVLDPTIKPAATTPAVSVGDTIKDIITAFANASKDGPQT